MLHHTRVFLVIALVAALFGFGGIVAAAVDIAKLLFTVFLALAFGSVIYSLMRKV